MITQAQPTTRDSSVQERITFRAFAQAVAMIHLANNRKDKTPGDPKVGGHPASCASSLHVLAALHLDVRRPEDFVCCKPHCSPVDHSLHNLMQLFRHSPKVDWFGGDGGHEWFTEDEAKRAMQMLRAFPTEERPHTFQSYHAATDADHFHFLPSGTVGIPPVVSGYLALAYRYAQDHGWEVPEGAHFWSLIGDSEFREGSLLEAMPDFAERQLGNVTWIIDYNRQNLDGQRMNNERGLEQHDCDRIERTALANGWRVIQVRHGKLRMSAFQGKGGPALRRVFEELLPDVELQALALKREPKAIRQHLIQKDETCKPAVEALSDQDLVRVLLDVGGHSYEAVRDALEDSRQESDEPYLLVVHTMKGWGLESLADPANHSTLPKKDEVEGLLAAANLSLEDPFAWFPADSEEGAFLIRRRDELRAGMQADAELIERNRAKLDEALSTGPELPATFEIDLSMMRRVHTQYAWGQVAAKLVRIGSGATEGADQRPLTPSEEAWAPAAQFVMTMSPDVGSSTNVSGAMNERVYGIEVADPELERRLEVSYKHPSMAASRAASTRHIRFEIAEANAMSAVGAFGKMGAYTGLPFFPVMTVYDFFIKRALDQLYYNVYWGGEFVILGTPSGVTLSPEGAQHSWKSDIQMPNLITWEPAFGQEVDWILSDALRRQIQGDNAGRQGVLVRGVTRELTQSLLLERLRCQAANKASQVDAPLCPAGAGWEGATDESSLPARSDAELLQELRTNCLLGGYRLIDWAGYQGYEPGDNVVRLFVMGALVPEAVAAADQLLEVGIFADVYVISSPELLLGILGEQDEYRHLREGLGVDGDLHGVTSQQDTAAGLVSLAARRIPCVAVCDGEAGLVDNIGSIVGVKQRTLAVRKFSKCGTPKDVYRYQELDPGSIAEACGQALAETATEDLVVPRELLSEHAARVADQPARANWRELWPGTQGA